MKTALVTGAGRGLGRAIALSLAESGYDVFVHAHASRSHALETARDVALRGRSARVCIEDLSLPGGVDRLVGQVAQATDKLHALVCSAALFEKHLLDELTRAHFQRMWTLNVEAPLFLTKALRARLEAGFGTVVNLLDGFERAPPGFAAYACTKAALESLTRSLAVELAPRVRVVGVQPGLIEFPDWVTDKARERLLARVPQARVGSPDEVARAVTWLCAEASYVTGHVLAVDGGRSVAP